MNQMLQEPEVQSQPQTVEASDVPDVPERPPAPVHPRFVKPQRVAFVQSSWHRDVVEECRIAFLEEIEARHISRAQVDLFEVPGSFEIPAACATARQDAALHRDRGCRVGGRWRHLPP